MPAVNTPTEPQVDLGYRHLGKVVEPAPTGLPGLNPGLKWYELRSPDATIDDVRAEALAILAAEPGNEPDDLGFVILHRCGEAFFYLLDCRWRNNNELWQTAYTKDGDARFELVVPGPTKATFCVWELGAVSYESQAWSAYLRSPRDDAARAAYLADRFSGPV